MALNATEPITLSSPNRKIEVRVSPDSSLTPNPGPGFQVSLAGKPLLQADLGLCIQGADICADVVCQSSQHRESDSTYSVPFGKSNPVRDHFQELILVLESREGPVKKFQVVIRAYDDGVAFRYVIPQPEGVEELEITDEPNCFRINGNPRAWPLYRENYTTSHEGLYTSARISELAPQRLIDLPFLMENEDGVSVALTEANLRNFAGLYVMADGAGDQRCLRSNLSPLPGQKNTKVRSHLPLFSPWRVLLIGTQPGRLLESNLLLNLNEPSVVSDLSWLKIGKTTWYWWNGPYQEPVDFTIGLNWPTMKHYLDFCARNGITFHAIMSTPDDYPWYHQTQKGFGPGPDTDITKPRDGFPMQRVCDYARSKNVGLRLWVHWKPLSEHLEEAFTQYEKWGIEGLMVDFLDRDDQEMVLFAERVLQSAARHHLHIHFHGVWKPTGLQRTYPNLLNHEGVLNLEYLKWSDQCDPKHNLTVPFTRMLAGPMDYHLGGFRSVRREEFKPQSMKPNVLGTRCHHLAMYVVFENPMPMVSDAPTAYEGQPGFDFIRQVPTTWDDTRVLHGQVGESIVVARRQGDAWYLGAMTDWTPRELKVPLNFLTPGKYQAEVWADVPDSSDPNQLTHQLRTVSEKDLLTLRLNSGGGQAVCIRPVRDSLAFIDTGFENASPLWYEFAPDGTIQIYLLYDHERSSPNRAAGHIHFQIQAQTGAELTLEFKNLDNVWNGRPGSVANELKTMVISQNGRDWQPITLESLVGNRVRLNLRMPGPKLYVARVEPYRISDLDKLLASIRNDPRVEITPIGNTVEGRTLEIVRIGHPDAPYRVFLRARAHPWEAGGNWVVQGLIKRLLQDDELATKYLQNYCVYIMPMANKDGVAHGRTRFNLQGKDLNRNWDQPANPQLAPENYALEQWLEGMIKAGRPPHLALELHNDGNGQLHISRPPVPELKRYLERMAILEQLLRKHTWFTVGSTKETFRNSGTLGDGWLERYAIDAAVHEFNCNWIEGLKDYPSAEHWEAYGQKLAEVFAEYFDRIKEPK